jgi:uncharacterized protein YprB with RNaseH-like and TPR domain
MVNLTTLRKSFIFLPGVGPVTERKLWNNDILDWGIFLERDTAGPLSGERKRSCDILITEAESRLESRDLDFLSKMFNGSDSWRLWDDLSEKAVYLDIETTGTRRNSPITVVGVYDGIEYKTAVRGKDLDRKRIRDLLSEAEMMVTFNGASFDLPMIELQYPGSVPKIPHLDLRFLSRKCGYSGGLKSIELQTGISRPDDVMGMSGEDAVRLWHNFERTGNRNALKLLLKYNMEDIVNLEPLTDMLVKDAKRRLFQ